MRKHPDIFMAVVDLFISTLVNKSLGKLKGSCIFAYLAEFAWGPLRLFDFKTS